MEKNVKPLKPTKKQRQEIIAAFDATKAVKELEAAVEALVRRQWPFITAATEEREALERLHKARRRVRLMVVSANAAKALRGGR